MKYYLISGEASGDLHGANLMAALKKVDANAEFRFWGGDLMAAQGGSLVKHFRELAFMGFVEVLLNIRTILKNLKFCKRDILTFNPDALILIDYPGFNFRIAEFAKKNQIPVHYYISPQVWAWKQNRVEKIKRDVDRLYCILPFEKQFYAERGVEVDFVGHPLIDAVENSQNKTDFRKNNGLESKPIIALLPGSRKQEISKMLSIMLTMKSHYSDHQFVIAAAPSQDESFYRNLIGENAKIIHGQTYSLLKCADAALVTSGTATLEAALHGVPEVVCYKTSWISYQIAKRLIHVAYISLVNLIMEKEVVKELIQKDLIESNLKKELDFILFDKAKNEKIKQDYLKLKTKLGGAGASERTAALIFNSFQNNVP